MSDVEPLPELVEGEGLVLRRWTVADAEVLEALVNENADHLRGYMPWVAELPLGLAGRRAKIEEWQETWLGGGAVNYGIHDGDALVGTAGLNRRIGPSGLDIGYWIDHRHLGHGYARRASAALTDAAFDVDGIDHVEIHHDETNDRSRRIPEQLGYEHIGEVQLERDLAPAETGREQIWRVTAEAWATARRARSTP